MILGHSMVTSAFLNIVSPKRQRLLCVASGQQEHHPQENKSMLNNKLQLTTSPAIRWLQSLRLHDGITEGHSAEPFRE